MCVLKKKNFKQDLTGQRECPTAFDTIPDSITGCISLHVETGHGMVARTTHMLSVKVYYGTVLVVDCKGCMVHSARLFVLHLTTMNIVPTLKANTSVVGLYQQVVIVARHKLTI